MSNAQKEIYRKLFFNILRIRITEDEIARLYPEQEMRCPVHLSVGQEATPVGVVAALNDTDYMVSTHRSHAHYMAKGGSLKEFLSELYGRETGCSRGQGGSMHLIDTEVNFISATSIVGGTIPLGVGCAFHSYLNDEDKVSVVCIGDTTVEEGVFHESMNFSALKKLPVFFCCENNKYACYTHISERQPERPIVDVAAAHNMKSFTLDGNDVFAVYEKMKEIIQEIRTGNGPVFGEFQTYRYLEHCGPYEDDDLGYRDEAEVKYWKEYDCIVVAREQLKEMGYYDEKWESDISKEITIEVKEAFAFAQNASYPSIEELGAYTYAKP